MIHPQTTTSLSKGEEYLTEVKVEAEAEIADLRMSKKKNSSAISMEPTLTTLQTNAPKRKKKLERMEAEKKARMVRHTSWSAPLIQSSNLPQQIYNPVFTHIPSFSYSPYPANWQPPYTITQRTPPQAPNQGGSIHRALLRAMMSQKRFRHHAFDPGPI